MLNRCTVIFTLPFVVFTEKHRTWSSERPESVKSYSFSAERSPPATLSHNKSKLENVEAYKFVLSTTKIQFANRSHVRCNYLSADARSYEGNTQRITFILMLSRARGQLRGLPDAVGNPNGAVDNSGQQ
jgi:hypothetical protein